MNIRRAAIKSLVIIMLQRIWNRWMTVESCVFDWEENEGDDETMLWEQALMQLLPSKENFCASDDGTAVRHVQQTETWDCGIACMLMAVRWLQLLPDTTTNIEEERRWMLNKVDTESIWSMDLVYLLEAYKKKDLLLNNTIPSFNYLFCSKTMQVDQDHKDLSFYQKAFHKDQVRVTQLFQQAQTEHWNLLQLADLGLNQVMELVRRPDCIAIALVDHAILQQKKNATTPYTGHYIVVYGVVHGDSLLIHNPTSSLATEYISSSLFEKAWRAKGTDNDIIFLLKQ